MVSTLPGAAARTFAGGFGVPFVGVADAVRRGRLVVLLVAVGRALAFVAFPARFAAAGFAGVREDADLRELLVKMAPWVEVPADPVVSRGRRGAWQRSGGLAENRAGAGSADGEQARVDVPSAAPLCRRIFGAVSISRLVVGRVVSLLGHPARSRPTQEVIMISRSLPLVAALLLALSPLAAQQAPTPQAEHHKLAQSVGTWDAVIETIDTDGTLHRSRGVSVQTMGPGGFWILDDFQGEMNGSQFTGHGALGYDPKKGAYVQSWISMAPILMTFTGTFDPAGKVLTMTGRGPGMDGVPIEMKNVTTWTSADSRTLEVFVVLPDGSEAKTMTITYTRRAAKHADNAGANK